MPNRYFNLATGDSDELKCFQVELGFRQGEMITVYGEMDEDGFYWGELKSEPGRTGLVPSNFLQEIHEGGAQMPGYGQEQRSSLMEPPQPSIMLGVGPPAGGMLPGFDQPATRPKGVAFTDTTEKKVAPARQISQTSSNKVNAVLPAAGGLAASAATKTPKTSTTANAVQNKVPKKSSDLSAKSGANSTRKPSQAPKKSDATSKGVSV